MIDGSFWIVLTGVLATASCGLLGTFLVRSGVLTSVHAFATDPARGVEEAARGFGGGENL